MYTLSAPVPTDSLGLCLLLWTPGAIPVPMDLPLAVPFHTGHQHLPNLLQKVVLPTGLFLLPCKHRGTPGAAHPCQGWTLPGCPMSPAVPFKQSLIALSFGVSIKPKLNPTMSQSLAQPCGTRPPLSSPWQGGQAGLEIK